ncbi:MAG: response regulator [Deltaproteobacteria bacterium]|nr:response regulator [Deltaproteobacteria bacterium]
MRIFVVDDDPMGLKAISLFLSKSGHDVESFSNGMDLLTKLESSPLPDLVLSDVYMPRMDGLELLKRVRDKFRDLPVVIMTSSRELDVTVKALNLGAFAYLLKPLVMEEVGWMVLRVSENNRLRQELAQEQERMVHSQRLAELGVLSAGIAHEINNPNTFIRGNLDLLAKMWEKITPKLENNHGQNDPGVDLVRKEFPLILKGMIEGSDRISQIVHSLSTYTRHESEPKTNETSSIENVMAETFSLLARKVDGIQTTVAGIEPTMRIRLPEVKLLQVLVNLLSNALDALAGRPEPIVTIQVKREGASFLSISVTDNGPGFSPQSMSKLGTPFYTTKGPGEGTGLGLYITHQIVTRCGGKLVFTQREGGGAVATATLPAVES